MLLYPLVVHLLGRRAAKKEAKANELAAKFDAVSKMHAGLVYAVKSQKVLDPLDPRVEEANDFKADVKAARAEAEQAAAAYEWWTAHYEAKNSPIRIKTVAIIGRIVATLGWLVFIATASESTLEAIRTSQFAVKVQQVAQMVEPVAAE